MLYARHNQQQAPATQRDSIGPRLGQSMGKDAVLLCPDRSESDNEMDNDSPLITLTKNMNATLELTACLIVGLPD